MLVPQVCRSAMSVAVISLVTVLTSFDAARAERPILRRSDGAPGEYQVPPRLLEDFMHPLNF